MESKENLEKDITFKTAFLINWLDSSLQQLTNEPSKDNINNVQEKLRRISLVDVDKLQNHLIFPADFHLRQGNISDTTKCMLIDYMKFVISKTSITYIMKFHQLLTLAFFQVYEFKNPSQLSNVSEELQISVLSFTMMLIKKITFERNELYSKENISKVGQALYITTKIIQKEKSFKIKLKGVQCIAKLTHCDCNSDDFPIEFQLLLSNSLKMLFPGLSTCLFSIIKQADLQQHELTKEALITWSRLVVLIMKDYTPSNSELLRHYQFKLHKKEKVIVDKATQCEPNKPGPSSSESKQTIISEIDMSSWIMTTIVHLEGFIKDLTSLSSHSHQDVREALATSASLLILHCSKNLGSTLLPLLEALLVLQEDEYPSVSSTAIEAQYQLRIHLNAAGRVSSLIDILEQGFLQHIVSLPGSIYKLDDEQQKQPFLLLRGYASVLGPTHLLRLLTPTKSCQQLLASLVSIFTLDIADVSLMASARVIDLSTTHDYRSRQWLQFAHLRIKDIDKLIDSVIDRIICSSEIIEYLLDEIINYYHREPLLRAEISIIINAICRSKKTSRNQLITILELYLDPANWHQLSTREEYCKETQRRVLEGCIQVEGLGEISVALGRNTPMHELIRILIAILERAGSSISLFSLAGRQALEKLACHVYDCSIPEILSKFSQHLATVLGTRIRREKDNVQITATLEVLAITLRFAGKKNMGYYRQAINDVISGSNCINARAPANGYLRVLKSLVQRISEWFKLNKLEESRKNIRKKTKNNHKNVINQLNEYHENKTRSTNLKDKIIDEKTETPDDVQQKEQNYYKEETIEDEDIENLITTAELMTHVLTVDSEIKAPCNDPQREQNEELETSDDIDQEEQDENEENEIKISDPLIDLLDVIIRRCMHYLPSKVKINRLLALEVIDMALPVFIQNSKFDDQKFLQVIHAIWPSMVSVFNHNSDRVLARVGWSVILTIVTTSKTFVKPRIMKDIWPGIINFLKKSETNFDTTSQDYKFLMVLLRDIPIFVNDLQFNEKEFYFLLSTCLPYLQISHPKNVQEKCRTFYEELSKINPDSVWLFLINKYKTMEIIPPSTCRDLYTLKIHVEKKNPYGANIEMILTAISQRFIFSDMPI